MHDEHPNVVRLHRVAAQLGPLCDELVFVGGAVTQLLITDPAASPVRPTLDVDAIVAVASRPDYWRLEQRLHERGLRPDERPGAPLCRWVAEGIVLDVMPTAPEILGFASRWCAAAIADARPVALPSALEIRVVTAPIFLAMKLEAFAQRGSGDLYGSKDLEDVISVVDGRPEIVDEMGAAAVDVRTFVSESLGALVALPGYRDAVAGHLGAEADRLDIVLQRLRALRMR